MKAGLGALILMMLVVVSGLWWVETHKEETGGILGTPRRQVRETATMPTPPPSPGGVVPEGWQQYTYVPGKLSWWYPPTMQVTEMPEGGVRFLLSGETQTEGNEVVDGILMTFTSGTYEAASFEDFVRQEFEAATPDSSIQAGTVMGAVNISGRTGYRFVVTGLGTWTHLYLPVDEKHFVRMMYLVADPTGKDYQSLVEAMFNSIAYGN